MSIATFIRENTDDGRNIVRFLIDVMDGNIEGCTLSHRLAAARLLTIYGQNDAPDFIADNPPDTSETQNGRKIWLEIDEGLRTLIKARTDDGRVMCMLLIDVMEGRIEGTHVGHRVSAVRELLSRAFGKMSPPRRREPAKSPTRTSRPSAPRRRPRKNRMTPERARFEAAVDERLAAQTAVIDEPDPQPERQSEEDLADRIYRAASRCIDPNFDPKRAATDDDYLFNYDGCDDIRCPYHGDPEDPDFYEDPNDHHY